MSSNYFMNRLAARAKEDRSGNHAATYYRTGANDGYWNASCECGWHSKAWTHRKTDVVREFKAHASKTI